MLGGGLVPGSLVLLGGSPGIGKSTLTSMALGHLAARRPARRSTSPARSPRRRSACAPSGSAHGGALDVPVLAETDLDAVLATLRAERPEVCVIDSVQTLHAAELDRRAGHGRPGPRGRRRGSCEVAKRRGTAVVLVGHVTKEGSLAGPRVLEHLVDCVLQFEGERERTYRTLRALKNRFGSTNEVGVFEMAASGLVEVLDASARFVGEATKAPGQRRARGDGGLAAAARRGPGARLAVGARAAAAGRATGSTATASRSCSPCSAATPASAVGTADVFVNVVGGVRIDEPGADLAVALAVASAARGVGHEPRCPLACFGEIGLTGELRSVAHPERRAGRGGEVRAARRSLSPARRADAPRGASRARPRASRRSPGPRAA